MGSSTRMGQDHPPRGQGRPGGGPGRSPDRPDGDPAADAPDATSSDKQDVLLVHSEVEAGDGYRVIRRRDDRIELGELRPIQDGRPLHGELVRLTPREESARLFDVKVLAEAPQPKAPARVGPAQVATDAYRSNWEAIFGADPRDKLTN